MISGVDTGKLGANLSTTDAKMMVAGVGEELGGDNQGPTPHEYLEAALAACTIITVKMYAQRKEIPLVATHVEVNTQKDKDGTTLFRHITFEGDMSEETKGRLMEIANKCPIHKLLSGKITIQTTQKELT